MFFNLNILIYVCRLAPGLFSRLHYRLKKEGNEKERRDALNFFVFILVGVILQLG